MKNIIFIISDITSGGGMQRVTINMANYLSNLNQYKIQIISLSMGDGKVKYFIDNKVDAIYLPIPKFKLRTKSIKAMIELRKVIPRDFEGIVIVDDVGYTIPVYAALYKNKNIKFICWTHMHSHHGRKFGFAWSGRRLAVSKFDSIIALTKEDKGYLSEIDKKNKVIQIYNPIDSGIKKERYSAESKKIISCGRLLKIKGFDYLIETARLVFAKHPDWTWDIYGDGEDYNNLKESINKYGLQNNVFLKGYHNNILSLYKEYSMYVFTSREEGCPMAMIEAMASGLPMISFDFKCGPKDLITEGVNGFIVKNYNINEMANKINYLIENQNKRIDFSNKSDINLNELKLNYVIKQWQKLLDNL